MSKLRIIGLVALGLIILLLITAVMISTYFNWRAARQPEYARFAEGTVPSKPLDGFYRGQTKDINTSWRGKKFDSLSSTGINSFKAGDRYRFHTYNGQSLTNHRQLVYKIDYNQSDNPWWLRFIVDELVQTAPDQFLGKIQVRILPGLSFTIGHFSLEK